MNWDDYQLMLAFTATYLFWHIFLTLGRMIVGVNF